MEHSDRLAVVYHFLLTKEMVAVPLRFKQAYPAVNPSEWDSMLRQDPLIAPYYLAVMQWGITAVTSVRTFRPADVLTVVLGQNESTDMDRLEASKRWLQGLGSYDTAKSQFYTLRLRTAEQLARMRYPVTDQETLHSLCLYSKYFLPVGVVLVRLQSQGKIQVVDLTSKPMSTTLAHHVGRVNSAELVFLYKTFD